VPVIAKAILVRQVWPFQAKPSASTITRCDFRSHSRSNSPTPYEVWDMMLQGGGDRGDCGVDAFALAWLPSSEISGGLMPSDRSRCST
jgi:hypothetical protein